MAHTLAQLQIEQDLEQMLHFNEIGSEVCTQSAREYPAIVILMISTHDTTLNKSRDEHIPNLNRVKIHRNDISSLSLRHQI